MAAKAKPRRREIDDHVEQTYNFLIQIPWTGDLRNGAEIAYGHHEKLNGRGYRKGQWFGAGAQDCCSAQKHERPRIRCSDC